MPTRRNAPSRPRAILWIAAALLLATLLSHLQLSVCHGSCHAEAAVASCCGEATPAQSDSCCGCCGSDDAESANDTDIGDLDGDSDTVRAGKPRCCGTAAFADIELAPAPALVHAPDFVPVVFVPRSQTWPAPDRRPLMRGRPFDRGPPRVEARIQMRASTVLLI